MRDIRIPVCATLAALAAAPAFGQAPPCAPGGAITERLERQYGESQQAYGLMPRQGVVVSLYVNPDSGSWTILIMRPDGIACMLAAGEAWTADQAPRGEGL